MQDKIENLKGIEFELIEVDSYVGFKISVIDHNVWKSSIDQLIPLFGKVIFEEYEKETLNLTNPDHQIRALNQIKVSFNDIDYMYVLEKDEKFVGLIALKVVKIEPKTGVVIELILDPRFRNKGISNILYDLVFKEKDFHAITSYSRYPAAVKARYSVGEKYGYETIFGDMTTDVEEVSALQDFAKKYFTEEGIVSDVATPKGYMFLKGDLNINEPLKEGDAKFELSDPLNFPFKKILEIQKTNDEDTAVGLLVSIKK
jgi:hypothetical protein